jgi:hypothetical protein
MTQTIRRATRRHQYVVVDQRAIEDSRLSWAARGLLAYLLSRPNDWRVLVNDLKKRGDLRRDGIYKLLRELRTAGYVSFEPTRDSRGRMRGGTYIVSEIPHTALPEAVTPDTASPRPADPGALPTTDFHSLTTTTTTTPTNTQTQLNERAADECLRFPDWLQEDMKTRALCLLSGFHSADAQRVIDEWTGAWAAGEIRVSELGYLKALVKCCRDGAMSSRYAGWIVEAGNENTVNATAE